MYVLVLNSYDFGNLGFIWRSYDEPLTNVEVITIRFNPLVLHLVL